MTDRELLDQFIRGDHAAFEELVRRHLNMIHAAARRQAAEHADDIVQAVFLLLAQKGGAISRRASVAGWLCQTVRYCSANVRKIEARRRRHEEEAASMSTQPDQSWHKLLPLLDDAIAALGRRERDAVLLRYLESRSIDEAARELGVSPDAAAKRAERGLEKLRKFFARHGYAASIATVSAVVAAESTKSAPASVAMVAQTAIAPTLSPAVTAIMKGARTMMTVAKIKSVAAVACICFFVPAVAAVVASETLSSTANPPASAIAPSTLPTTQPTTQPAISADYKIRPGDVLSVGILDLMGEGTGETIKTLRVQPDGSCQPPFLGPVPAGGLTTAQLESAINKAYNDARLLRNAPITVKVIQTAPR